MKRVFALGNGESRLQLDLEKLRGKGVIYGCCRLYQDFTPDVLIAVDHGMMHEIYHSGYTQKHESFFRDWTRLPADVYDMTLSGLSPPDMNEKKLLEDYDFVQANDRGNSKEFVMHGVNLQGAVQIVKQYEKDFPNANKEIIKKKINKTKINISWIKEPCKAKDIRDYMPEKGDKGWSSGTSAAWIACEKEKPDEVFIIGHDLYSSGNFINNVYKDTKHYQIARSQATPCINWITQWRSLINEHPKIKFWKVNEKSGTNVDNVNREIQEWKDFKNLKYCDFKYFKNLLHI